MRSKILTLLPIAFVLCLSLIFSSSAQKTQEEEEVDKLVERIKPLLKYSIEELELALKVKVRVTYAGARIVADDQERTFLGTIEDEFSSDSIFNEYGKHGSEYQSNSIWNEYGAFGGEYSQYSPFNDLSSSPPYIILNGKTIGRLTVNDLITGAVDPNWLKQHFVF